MMEEPEGLRHFRTVWETFRDTPDRDLIITTVKMGDEQLMLNHALSKLWNDTSYLPNALRDEIIAELAEGRTVSQVIDGRRWEGNSRAYWKERVHRVSQAARALCPLIARRMVNPRPATPPR
ncbi:hypothetical protein ACFOEZ_04130 [Tianweitania populi]|uniref:Uncharacterized protein n=1 Tax=Tianweitania populi TaxID=1607949 RepID=A0A8J3GJH6_9HYPH|nr:hypothetical protein [Tianweitania populi]GHD07706.1 hypothetical protein GCM10016234_06430 [Tianweitania populi]